MCFFCLSLYQQDWPSGIPGSRGQAESLEQGRCTFGGRGSGLAILEQTGPIQPSPEQPPGMGHPQLPWATLSSALLPSK